MGRRFVDDFPVELGHSEDSVTVGVVANEDLGRVAVDVVQGGDAVGAGVDDDVVAAADGVVAGAVLELRPVGTVERLPLRGHVQEPEGRPLLRTVDEVGVGSQVTTGQEMIS